MSKKLIYLICFVLVLALVSTDVAFGQFVWEGQINKHSDEPEELDPSGAPEGGSSDLEFPYEDAGKGDKQLVGLRWEDVDVPKGARILDAWIEFMVDETGEGTTHVSVIIEGELNPNPPTFTNSTTSEVANRQPRTTAQAIWEPEHWTAVGEKHQTSNIGVVIEEIVNQDGWVNGNALVLIIRDNPANPSVGRRVADSYDGNAEGAPLLHIEYVTSVTRAAQPSPADRAIDMPRDAVLSWTPGDFANTHDLYFGVSFEDVNTATTASPEYKVNQTETAYALDRLDFSRTYYWRVDEVNAPPDNTIFKGDVWSFTVEPFAYPLADVNATASSSNAANEGPENTINSSGLDADDLHSAVNTDMWLSSVIDPNEAWIQYELDRVYKLHQMLVWNYNSSVEPVIGFGIKEATIEYSADGANWITLGTHEFARGSGTSGYESNTTVDLSGVVARYVKITANSNWGGFVPQYGLSEVRFFYIPVWAREPAPASGSTDMDVDNVTLSWRAGREAASHEVQLSDSNQAVIDGTALVATVSESSYDTGELQLNQSYYWKIVEVNEAETPTNWEGDVLNFTTREFLVVDDFEDYNNFSPHRVFQRWIDGIGYSADKFFPVDNPGNGTGAAIGHDIWSYDSPHYDGDIMETAIVHGGAQSAPLYYDNTIAPFTSEIVCTFDVPQDWTKHGIKTLSLYFYGDPNNVAQQMYVKLNGTKVVYDGEAANLTRAQWQSWNIDLADLVGVNLSNVTELTIGLERSGLAGGKGVVYFDDINLYPYSRELITPAEPDTANLVAHYEFEGNANDSSGNGRNGAVVGDPIFVAGKVGQVISLDGIGDYVEITGYKGILGPNAITVTAWINTISTETGTIINWGTQSGSQRIDFRINADRLRVEHGDGNVQGNSNVNDGGWHHVAVTVQENATISHPEVILYLDGIDDTRPGTDPNAFNITANVDVSIGYRATNNDRYFMGQIDDVRIYNRVLLQEEISWMAGRTQPFDKPF